MVISMVGAKMAKLRLDLLKGVRKHMQRKAMAAERSQMGSNRYFMMEFLAKSVQEAGNQHSTSLKPEPIK